MSPTAPEARVVSPQEQLASISTERCEKPAAWLWLEEIEPDAPDELLEVEWARAKLMVGLVRDRAN